MNLAILYIRESKPTKSEFKLLRATVPVPATTKSPAAGSANSRSRRREKTASNMGLALRPGMPFPRAARRFPKKNSPRTAAVLPALARPETWTSLSMRPHSNPLATPYAAYAKPATSGGRPGNQNQPEPPPPPPPPHTHTHRLPTFPQARPGPQPGPLPHRSRSAGPGGGVCRSVRGAIPACKSFRGGLGAPGRSELCLTARSLGQMRELRERICRAKRRLCKAEGRPHRAKRGLR